MGSVEYIVKVEDPPNIETLREVFPLTGREIFAWDGVIYNPSGSRLPQELIDHEMTHFRQQDGDAEGWWARYITDVAFRLEQELEAHQVEYKSFCKYNKDRNKQARYLQLIARRLASPMYGGVLSGREAARRIKSG